LTSAAGNGIPVAFTPFDNRGEEVIAARWSALSRRRTGTAMGGAVLGDFVGNQVSTR